MQCIHCYISVHVRITSMMMSDSGRWKLSILEYHPFWSVRDYLIGNNLTVTLISITTTNLQYVHKIDQFHKG